MEEKSKSELEALLKPFEGILKAIGDKNPGLAGGIAGYIAGSMLMLDDAKDLGKFSTKDHPDPLHHWMWGALLMMGSMGTIFYSLADMISKLPPPPKDWSSRSKMPIGLLEQGFPLEQVEKLK
jgi:hypothetical protein